MLWIFQIYKLELEQKRLEEDAFVYNWLQQQLKLSPAYKKVHVFTLILKTYLVILNFENANTIRGFLHCSTEVTDRTWSFKPLAINELSLRKHGVTVWIFSQLCASSLFLLKTLSIMIWKFFLSHLITKMGVLGFHYCI